MTKLSIDKAIDESLAWLTLADKGRFEETWVRAGNRFQVNITKVKWTETLSQLRSSLGKVATRIIETLAYSRSLPDLPRGEYIVVTYQAIFSEKGLVVEAVVLEREGDSQFHVIGYFVKDDVSSESVSES